MDAFRIIDESRKSDVNPFREMLQKMGAFGGPTMGDMAGVPGRTGPPPAQQQSPELQRLVQSLVAQGVPEDQALQQAQQLMSQRRGV
jgi:hypothetical protein